MAHRKASRDIRQAKVDCERQLTSGLSTRCDEAGMRIVQNPVRSLPYTAEGSYKKDRRETNEDTCRRRAMEDATRNAMETCQRDSDMPCKIQREATVRSFREVSERRYSVAGPKDTYLVCEADASAVPNNDGYVCAVEVFTRIDLD